MSKKKKAGDGKCEVLVDGKDQKRLEELTASVTNLQNALKANQETFGFILKAYAKQGEQITNYNKDTGLVTVRKGPVAPPAPPVPPREPGKKG